MFPLPRQPVSASAACGAWADFFTHDLMHDGRSRHEMPEHLPSRLESESRVQPVMSREEVSVAPVSARIPFHLLRSTTVAATVVLLAALAHILGGGSLPGAGIMAAILAMTGLVSTLATRRQLRLPAMIAILGAGQLTLHEVFTALSVPASGTSPVGTGHHLAGQADLGSWHALPVAQAVDAAAGHAHQVDSPLGALMLTGHVVATLLCAGLLAKGEAALWFLAAWLSPLVELPSPVMPDGGTAPAAVPPRRDFTPLPWRNLRQDCRRGPPAVVVLF